MIWQKLQTPSMWPLTTGEAFFEHPSHLPFFYTSRFASKMLFLLKIVLLFNKKNGDPGGSRTHRFWRERPASWPLDYGAIFYWIEKVFPFKLLLAPTRWESNPYLFYPILYKTDFNCKKQILLHIFCWISVFLSYIYII